MDLHGERLKVLCVTDYYLPGYRAGGPIRAISNLCRELSDRVEFFVFTRDRDLGDKESYAGVRKNSITLLDGRKVYYAGPRIFGWYGLLLILRSESFGLIYLNSFFSLKGSISIYFFTKFFVFRKIPVLIAPRGEFGAGALGLKRVKKNIFLGLVRTLALYRDVWWQASSEREAEDINKVIPMSVGRTYIAPDLVTYNNLVTLDADARGREDESTRLRLVFISRISRMKNLDGLIGILSKVSSDVALSIHGPIEDVDYWESCCSLIRRLPRNVSVEYKGVLEADSVARVFSVHDLFVFPTLGENFGYVIFESLSVGTPVVISERTPWRGDPSGAITEIPLEAEDSWVSAIESAARLEPGERDLRRRAALAFSRAYVRESGASELNLSMFREVALRSN